MPILSYPPNLSRDRSFTRHVLTFTKGWTDTSHSNSNWSIERLRDLIPPQKELVKLYEIHVTCDKVY